MLLISTTCIIFITTYTEVFNRSENHTHKKASVQGTAAVVLHSLFNFLCLNNIFDVFYTPTSFPSLYSPSSLLFFLLLSPSTSASSPFRKGQGSYGLTQSMVIKLRQVRAPPLPGPGNPSSYQGESCSVRSLTKTPRYRMVTHMQRA